MRLHLHPRTLPALVAGLAAFGVAAQEPTSKPDRTTQERKANQAAYERDYLPQAKTLRANHNGGWLVIAHGVILPRDGDALAPAKSWQDADAAARKSLPDTRHRFVIRIGDEGDQKQGVGMTERHELAGSGLLRAIGGVVIHGGGVQARRGAVPIEIGGSGPELGSWVGLALTAPGAPATAKITKLVAINVFPGHATLEHARALSLGLANWEIPGTMILEPGYGEVPVKPLARCRRAWLHCRIEKLDWNAVVPAAIWPAAQK